MNVVPEAHSPKRVTARAFKLVPSTRAAQRPAVGPRGRQGPLPAYECIPLWIRQECLRRQRISWLAIRRWFRGALVARYTLCEACDVEPGRSLGQRKSPAATPIAPGRGDVTVFLQGKETPRARVYPNSR